MANMLSNQSKLPARPLPTIAETCKRYLNSVKPFLTDEEYLQTEFEVNLFENGHGKRLHEKLENLSSYSKNWVQDFWNKSYLYCRSPLPAVCNVGLTEYEYEMPVNGSQYKRGAMWVHSAVKQYLKIVGQDLRKQRSAKGSPLDMLQFLNFFCGSRIPGEHHDLQTHAVYAIPKPDGSMEVMSTVKHIIVLMKGRIFKLDVFGSKGALVTPQNLESFRPVLEARKLKCNIKIICDKEGDGISVGSLTAADRDTWYKMYKQMCRLDRQNKINIDVINEAIMAFAFDDIETYGLQDTSHHAVLGDCVNRWYDKSLTAITSTTGLVVTNVDHVHVDGNVGSTILQNIYDDLKRRQITAEEEDITQDISEPIELQFTLDDVILKTITETQQKHQITMSQIELHDEAVNGYGKTYSKSYKIHPDTLVQLAIQLGYFSLHKRFVPTYEAATTRMYYTARTDVCRSSSLALKEWVEAMCDDKYNIASKKQLLHRAAKKHMDLMSEGCTGKGIDRHLFILKVLAEEEGIALPSIYTDKAWEASGGNSKFVISSSLAGFLKVHGGLSPMILDGYGTFYTIEPHRVNLFVSTFKKSTETNCKVFYQSIVDALDSIHELLAYTAIKKSKL